MGEDITERTIYPLYLLIKQISTVDFLGNLDAIVALNMIITAYIKGTIYLFAAFRSIQLLLKIQNSRSIIFPVACITYFLGMTMSNNNNEHIYVGTNMYPQYLKRPLHIILPGILLTLH